MPDQDTSKEQKSRKAKEPDPSLDAAPSNGAPRPDPSLNAAPLNGALRPDLSGLETHRAQRLGDTYIRIMRPDPHAMRRVAPGVLQATEQVYRPESRTGRLFMRVKQFLVGRPLPTAEEKHERLTKLKALPIFSSDAISSSAYATEEILIVLVTAGAVGLGYALPVAFGIALLLVIVSFSYRQTVHAYPHGGGSYTVSRENLGTQAGLIGAAALLIDYVLTVAVSISAGTAAITSAFEPLFPYRVEISLFSILIITLINLRGVRESGTIFALPTYLFITSLAAVILLGVARLMLDGGATLAAPRPLASSDGAPVTLFLLLHAFAAGSVAMSGTEAIANGVPSFKPPESKNAATTLTLMSSILGFFFVGVTFLAGRFGIEPSETETVIAQIARTVLGYGPPFLIFQAATMLILVLAANTSFAGFPRLASILAQDGFMPHQMSFRGDRLAFSNGIVILGVVAAALVMAFGGSTHALIPLYAIGVFISFTLSQSGMVRHWWRFRESGWRKSMVINATGAVLTAIVLVVVGSVKFTLGAWMVLILVPLLVLAFNAIHHHYRLVKEQLKDTGDEEEIAPPHQIVIVPIGEINRATLRALAYARSLTSHAIAVSVVFDEHEVAAFKKQWERRGLRAELLLLESPYRSFNGPLLAYIQELHRREPEACVTIVLPEFVPAHWWEHFLHNQTALRLKAALFFQPNTVTIDVPTHLKG